MVLPHNAPRRRVGGVVLARHVDVAHDEVSSEGERGSTAEISNDASGRGAARGHGRKDGFSVDQSSDAVPVAPCAAQDPMQHEHNATCFKGAGVRGVLMSGADHRPESVLPQVEPVRSTDASFLGLVGGSPVKPHVIATFFTESPNLTGRGRVALRITDSEAKVDRSVAGPRYLAAIPW